MKPDRNSPAACRLGRSCAPRGTARLLAGLLAPAVLAGCAGAFGTQSAAPAPAASQDPLSAFVSQAQPGAAGRVTLADGRPATVRVTRSYYAASGRECREVSVATGTAPQTQILCAMPGGGWAEARPLLRGGVGRP